MKLDRHAALLVIQKVFPHKFTKIGFSLIIDLNVSVVAHIYIHIVAKYIRN